MFTKVLVGDQTVTDFLTNTSEIISDNAKLLLEDIRRLGETYNESLPKPYNNMFTEVCKNVAVAGYIQVNSSKAINLLRSFCKKRKNLRSGLYREELQEVRSQLPVIWKQISAICIFEGTDYLPDTTSNLVLRLLEIRKMSFESSATRYAEQYYDYDGQGVFMEHPLEFFPKNPLIKYPKNYQVSGNVDEDFCAKSYPTHSDFASGIFTVGCSCEKPITMGFTLMLKGESPRNIFRILMTRKWQRNKLRGLIYDHACGAHRYFLNREPKDFKNFNFIVDGCHMQGQRRMKKGNPSTGKSHLGCSQSELFIYGVQTLHTATQRWGSSFPGP